MALGATTYKTPNIINLIGSDLTSKEGCGVSLAIQSGVQVATSSGQIPYGVVVVGGTSVDGTYPGPIAGSAIEFVDQLGCVVQIQVGSNWPISAGEFVTVDESIGDGSFVSLANQPPAVGSWVWGMALTDADVNEQCLMRFQPYSVFSTYTPPEPPPEL